MDLDAQKYDVSENINHYGLEEMWGLIWEGGDIG